MCPWNVKFSQDATEPAFAPRTELATPAVETFAAMNDAAFKQQFGDTPLMRAKRAGLQRNAVAVLRHARTAGDGR